MNNSRRLLRASFTIEAALIVPLLIFAVFGVLYLSFHLHNFCCLYSSAAEQAVSGHEQEPPAYFGMQGTTRTGSESSSERTVGFRSGTFHFNGQQLYSIETEASYRIVRPAKTVRLVLAVKDGS